jgi:hypothetical protein
MRSIPLTMTWEMLWRGRWGLPAAALGANLLPAILLAALRHEGAVVPEDPSQIVIHITLVQINMFSFAVAVFMAQGQPSRLYAFPVPTSVLVAWHLLPAMAAVAIQSVVSTAALNATFHLNWPLWGPALFVAVALAWVQAAAWLTEKSAWMVVATGAVATVWGLGFKSRYGAVFSQPSRYWMEVTPAEILTILVFAILAYCTAVVAVARNRRGEALLSLGIVAWLDRLFDSAPDLGLHFRSPAQAQLWFEWRHKGWAMPGAVVFSSLFGFGAWLMFSRDAGDLFHGFVVGGGLLSMFGLLGGLVMGNSGQESNFEIGSFLATRPITNTQLARTILKAAAKSVLIAWIIWAATFLALYLLLVVIDVVPKPALPKDLGWWYFPATVLGPWIVLALVASLGLTGRSRPFMDLFVLSFAIFIVLSLYSKFALSHQAQAQLARGVVDAIAAAMVIGTSCALAAARRRALVGWPTVYVAAGMWGALSAPVVLEWILRPAAPFHICALFVGIAALAVAPLATAPLALAWNRNR